ncbi:unnamed protein product, partial [Laminaria digitata]
RVGFVSSHFRWHSVGRLAVGLLENLSRSARLDIFIVDISTNGDSARGQSSRLNGSGSLPSDKDGTRQTITALALDVLVFGDVGMDALTTGLAYGHLAPVQVAFWGHPGTTGLPAIDYFVTSDLFEGETDRRIKWHVDPALCGADRWEDRQGAFSEQLVRLDGLSIIFDDPVQTFDHNPDNDATTTLARENANRPRLYVCAQSLMKMHPAFDAVLAGILTADPLAHVVLLRDSRQLLWHSRFRRRLRTATPTAARGGFWNRVKFVSPLSGRDFFRLQCRADVVLDPFPFGGGVTMLEVNH